MRLLPLTQAVVLNPKLDRGALTDDTEVSFVPMAAVEAASGRMDPRTIRRYAEVKKGYTHFRDGDVLFAKITPCMENGKMAVAHSLRNGIGLGSTEFHVLRPNEGVNAHYVYHFVSSRRYRSEAAHHMTGAVGQKRVPLAFLEQSQIPLPEIDEQRRIVAEIEKQFSRLDEAVAGLKRVKANLKRYKQAALDDVLRPTAEACVLSLSDVCDVISGFAFKSEDFASTGIPVIKIANVGYGEFLRKDQEYLPPEFLVLQKDFEVLPGDLLIALTRPVTDGTLKACRYPDNAPPALVNQRVAVLRARTREDRDYLLVLLQSPGFKRLVLGAVSQTLQPNLSPVQLRRFGINWPNEMARRSIVAEIDRRLSVVREVEAEVEANLRRARALRQAVLAKSFQVFSS